MTRFSYDEIVKSRKSKYDIAMKSFMLSQDSELRNMLRLPSGDAYSAEFPGYDGRATDTIIVRDRVYHVEFQTKDVQEMPWRMLEYYWILYRQFSGEFKQKRTVDQTLVYIGNDDDPFRMKPPLQNESIRFYYKYVDIRDIGDRASSNLLKSATPFDWILRVLCYRNVDRRTWELVAARVVEHCRLKSHTSQNLKVYLLVAMALRNLELPLVRKLCEMLEVRMDKIPVFKEKIDDAEYLGNVTGVADSIQEFVINQLGMVAEGFLDPLHNFPLDHLRQLRSSCYQAKSSNELYAVLADKFNELGLRLGR